MKGLETERLYLREMTPDDAVFAFNLNADLDVIKYTGDKPFDSVDAAKEFLKQYDHYRKYGFGRWGVELKETGDLLGWCGLKYTESLNEYDIGFRFLKKNWNKGYATEAAIHCIEIGFNKFGMDKIVGRVMKENIASIKVLTKLGFEFKETFDYEGDPTDWFELKKENWGKIRFKINN